MPNKRPNSLNKIETSHYAMLVLTHELVFICSYFSPMLPPFCFWNSMYRKVLEKNASVDGSATELSLCFSVLINSIKSWITVFVICGIPFSKKYKYLKMVKARGLLTQKSIIHQKNIKSSSRVYLFKISINRVADPLLPLVALAICWAAFAILKARFKQRRTLKQSFN
jgi:hypothetical protein